MPSKRGRDQDTGNAEANGEEATAPRPNEKLRLFVDQWSAELSLPSFGCDPNKSSLEGPTQRIRKLPVGHSRCPTYVPFLATEFIRRQQRSSNGDVDSDSVSVPTGTGFMFHADTLLHRNDASKEAERPERVERTLDHLTALHLVDLCKRLECRRASTKELRLVHSERHIDTVDQWGFAVEVSGEQALSVGTDLYACKETSRAARLAAGGVIEATLAVCRGDVKNAFALIRPPGHHCTSTAAAGFCFFNNVAVAARVAQQYLSSSESSRRPRILIVDWDVHHCDGTEEVFYDDPSVCVFSIHQYGSLPPHKLRKTHQPVKPTTVHPQVQEISTADLLDLFDDLASKQPDGEAAVPDAKIPHTDSVDQSGAPSRNAEQCESVTAAPVEPSANSDSAPVASRSGRARKPIDFKALAASMAEEKVDADNYFATKGLLKTVDVDESREKDKASGESSESDSSDEFDLGSDISSGDAGDCALQKRQQCGDSTGTSNTEEDVDQDGLFYPGTGHIDRVGDLNGHAADPANRFDSHRHQPAAGRNINVPWPAHGFGDLEYCYVLEKLLVPIAQEFQPELILVSCGFDCAEGDMLGSMRVTPSGFRAMTRIVSSLCDKVVVALEGGYNVTQVAKGAEAVLRELLRNASVSPDDFKNAAPPSTMLFDRMEYLVDAVKSTHAPYWRCFADCKPATDGED